MPGGVRATPNKFVRVWNGTSWVTPFYNTGSVFLPRWEKYHLPVAGEYDGPIHYEFDASTQAVGWYWYDYAGSSSNPAIWVSAGTNSGYIKSGGWTGTQTYIQDANAKYLGFQVGKTMKLKFKYKVTQTGTPSVGYLDIQMEYDIFSPTEILRERINIAATADTGWKTYTTTTSFVGLSGSLIYEMWYFTGFSTGPTKTVYLDDVMLIDTATGLPAADIKGEDPGMVPKIWDGTTWASQNME